MKNPRTHAPPTKLTALRLRAGLSQTQLASLAGSSQSHIDRLERGENDPGTDIIARIARALRVPEAEVFTAIRTDRRAFGN